ncbi:DUF1330 domain-containing protein [Mangrovimonas sp. TPBH4]|uniref:DUF1330 domain-containing protein n=1 Tax=Mangrovimonas sp. TPBH4 TaxID=1645914 RepID=UPI0006B5E9BF|nr:DUF1330 domain-containing protein [Mangrovimonas sp. TPBH4]
METYFIISYDIVDFETFQKYPPAVLEILQQYGGELLVSDTEALAIEGEKKMMHAIIKFPSQEMAMECFNSEEYQAVRPFRINSTKDNTVIMAKAFNPNA